MATTKHPRIQAVTEDARVTPIELFFDLVFVFSLTQVTALMSHNLSATRGRARDAGALPPLVVLGGVRVGGQRLARGRGHRPRGDVRLDGRDVRAGALRARGVRRPARRLVRTGRARHHVPLAAAVPSGDLLAGGRARSRAPPAAACGSSPPCSSAPRCCWWRRSSRGRRRCSCGSPSWSPTTSARSSAGASGWRLNSASHFAERHGLIVIIALGESIVATGFGRGGAPHLVADHRRRRSSG